MSTNQTNRTRNSIYNLVSGSFGQLLIVFLTFITRSVFLKVLGSEYLGINGLFSNILSMLSLAELGVGTAITYNLYKPIAEQDDHRILLLMKFYKLAYRVIGLVILVMGILLLPFLRFLIKDYNSLQSLNINIYLIFCLYLLQSISTYLFFAYKNTLITAHQMQYKLNMTMCLFTIGVNLVQILVLFVFRSFILYTVVVIIFNISQNIVFSIMTDRMFPYMKKKITESLSIAEIKALFKDCYALFLYKINYVVINSTDNIVISSFIGIITVGLYSNYLLIYKAIKQVLDMFYIAVTASLGNLNVTADANHKYKIYEAFNFITALLFGTAAIGVFVVGDSFINRWLGTKYVIAQPFSLLLGIEIYTLGIRTVLAKFRNTMGLFQQGKYRPVAGIIINVIVSILLVKPLGIYGVMIGTIVADCATFVWFDPIIIHKYGFGGKHHVSLYFRKFIKYVLITCLAGAISWSICSLVDGAEWLLIILKSGICIFVSCAMFVLFNLKSHELNYFTNLFLRIARRKIN